MKPANPHPDFPVGAAVRVRPIGATCRPAKRRLAGRVGTVVISGAGELVVAFPGEQYREHFQPRQLERVPD